MMLLSNLHQPFRSLGQTKQLAQLLEDSKSGDAKSQLEVLVTEVLQLVGACAAPVIGEPLGAVGVVCTLKIFASQVNKLNSPSSSPVVWAEAAGTKRENASNTAKTTNKSLRDLETNRKSEINGVLVVAL